MTRPWGGRIWVPINKVGEGEKALILRRIGYRDQDTGKRFEFLTNHMTLPARTIADIYK